MPFLSKLHTARTLLMHPPLFATDVNAATPPHPKLLQYLRCTQAFNDHALLPGPRDPGVHVNEPGRLHVLHPAMQWRKLHERPFNELHNEHRKHNENVYDSTLENYAASAWNTLGCHEPLLPVRRNAGP